MASEALSKRERAPLPSEGRWRRNKGGFKRIVVKSKTLEGTALYVEREGNGGNWSWVGLCITNNADELFKTRSQDEYLCMQQMDSLWRGRNERKADGS